MTTISEDIVDEFYERPERMCDCCERVIEWQDHYHWEEKDFDLCSECVMELYQKMFGPFSNNESKRASYKKTPIPNEIRWSIWKRDDFTCQYCGSREDLSVDHVMPESRGGEMVETNLVTACRKCNSKKNARTPEEAGMKLLKNPKG